VGQSGPSSAQPRVWWLWRHPWVPRWCALAMAGNLVELPTDVPLYADQCLAQSAAGTVAWKQAAVAFENGLWIRP